MPEVYVCDPEWCDDGYHVEAPEEIMGWHMPTIDPFEYANYSEYWLFIPEDGDLKVTYQKAWRMPCGVVFMTEPEKRDLASVESQQTPRFAESSGA